METQDLTTIEPEILQKMKPEELTELYRITMDGVDAFIAQQGAIKDELAARLQQIGEKSKEWGGYTVTRYPRKYFNNVSLETARQFAATQMTEPKEVINTTILSRLVDAGKEIPGAEVRMETRIAAVKKGEDNG